MMGRALWWSVMLKERAVWLSVYVGQKCVDPVAGTGIHKCFGPLEVFHVQPFLKLFPLQ